MPEDTMYPFHCRGVSGFAFGVDRDCRAYCLALQGILSGDDNCEHSHRAAGVSDYAFRFQPGAGGVCGAGFCSLLCLGSRATGLVAACGKPAPGAAARGVLSPALTNTKNICLLTRGKKVVLLNVLIEEIIVVQFEGVNPPL